MNLRDYKSYILVTGVVLLAMVFGLWSWNTLAELFGGPQAQFKHAVAASILALASKWIFTGRGNHRCRGDDHCSLIES